MKLIELNYQFNRWNKPKWKLKSVKKVNKITIAKTGLSFLRNEYFSPIN